MRRHAKALESLDRGSVHARAPPTCSTSRRRSCAICSASAASSSASQGAGHRPGPRPDAQRDRVARPEHGPRLRHRGRRPGQPHRHHGRRPGNPRRRRPRQVRHRCFRRRRDHRRRQPRRLILNPDEETARTLRSSPQQASAPSRAGWTSCAICPPRPRTAPASCLLGNIEFPQEATHCLDRGADGVGLYRTEFLYLNKTTDPTEAEHLDAYLTVLRTLGPQAGGHPHARPGGRQVRHARRNRATRSAIRSWACAASACVCGI